VTKTEIVEKKMKRPTEESEESLTERLRKVYSEAVVSHVLHPHNSEGLPHPDGFAECQSNCGESMKIWLKVRDSMVVDAGFWTNGCAATIACGSQAVVLARGKTVSEALSFTAQDIAGTLELPSGNFHNAELAVNTLRMALRDCLAGQRHPWKRLYRR
jgi:nitrogen fixation protein NifU and related proteins